VDEPPVDARRTEAELTLRARLQPEATVCRQTILVEDVEPELRQCRADERDATVEQRDVRAVRVAEHDRLVVAEP
jgi:hypothetical protein